MSPENGKFEAASDPDATMDMPRDEDPRLVQAVEEYLAEMEAGRRPNRQEFLARHADIAAELSLCLQGMAFVTGAASQAAAVHAETESDRHVGPSAQALGDFRLLREIGRGGMGIVYEAMQLSLGRRVAVKVLPLASALDPRHLQRFRNEAHAAAQLHHNNIVPVYAVGHERSVHFYAMQLIEGQSLAEAIGRIRESTGRDIVGSHPYTAGKHPVGVLSASDEPLTVVPGSSVRMSIPDRSFPSASAASNDLSSLASSPANRRAGYYRQVARLGLQAAEALDYAHRQGVVHRDIKPANLLLDGQNKLWISDFGLAQIYSDNGLTQTGDVLGTFRYMSPEQASGNAVVLDQRTDVYSLGMTLYELLTLERALPGETREELLRQIESMDPRPPRMIDRGIPQELETIILKAVAKDAAERYFSAGAFAEDLRRFLADEPILARPPSAWNKAVKWIRRHKAIALSAVLLLVFMTIASLVATLLIAIAHNKTSAAYSAERTQRARAEQQRAQAERQRARAEENYQEARRAVDYFTRVAAEQVPKEPAFVQIKQNMLETALDYYQQFLEQRTQDGSKADDLTATQAQVTRILQEVSAAGNMARLDYAFELVRVPDVQKDLQLTPGQVDKLDAFHPPHGPPPPPPGSKPPEDGSPPQNGENPMETEAAERQSALTSALSPNQWTRLQQISRQVRGLFAFSDPDVSSILQLAILQKQNIRERQAEFSNYVHGMHFNDGRGQSQDLRSQMNAAVDQLLTQFGSSQADAWRALIGPKYAGEAPSPIQDQHGNHAPGPSGGGPPPNGEHQEPSAGSHF